MVSELSARATMSQAAYKSSKLSQHDVEALDVEGQKHCQSVMQCVRFVMPPAAPL